MFPAIILSALIGISLAVLGGGGSILTVPILIYALGVPEKPAIATSLLVVGITAAVAAVQHAKQGNVVWRVSLSFAGAAMIGAYAGARVAKWIPAPALLVMFAIVMFAAAIAMWRGRKEREGAGARDASIPKIAAQGVAVGALTGMIGVGGGFLVVPALALLGGLSMNKAIGSSLVVIALSSMSGFLGYVSHVAVDYELALVVTASAVGGSFAGARIGRRLRPTALRKGFAVFVAAMAIYVLSKQLL